MSVTVNIHEAKTHLSRLLQRVVAGEEVIIAKSGAPIARLVPFASEVHVRTPGSAKGLISISPDFGADLPDEILAAFEGEAGV